MGRGLGGALFKPGSGSLLRTCAEGERQHVERRASGMWSSLKFGDRVLGEGVWVGFRPHELEGDRV